MPRYERGTQTFINPYHFVRLDSEPCDRQDRVGGARLISGWIECELTSLTPLFIPNSSNDDVFHRTDAQGNKIKSYDFFSYIDLAGHADDQSPPPPCPVIPGSELRGVVRSAFEAVTRSCMSSIDDDAVLYKRTSVPARPGLLTMTASGWRIQPCERYGVAFAVSSGDPTDPTVPGGLLFKLSTMSDGQSVWVKPAPAPQNKYRKRLPNGNVVSTFLIAADINVAGVGTCPAGWLGGIFHKGEQAAGQHKHHESVFVGMGVPFAVSDDDVARLRRNVELYAVHPAGHTGYRTYPDVGVSATDVPVYYVRINQVYYLSPAGIGREVFCNTLRKLLDQQGHYQPCVGSSHVCPACSLFGMVGEGAVASRVRFSDAILAAQPEDLETLFHPWACLPELASPKPSATEFYLRRPGTSHIWNYDYAGNWQVGGNGNYRMNSLMPLVPKNYAPAIRGRKFYWHKASVQTPPRQENEPRITKDGRVQVPPCTERNVWARCVRPRTAFTFKVFFDNVSELELERLLWVLSLGGRTVGGQPTHALKIGMGKPVGLGSVRIVPHVVVQREFVLNPEGCFDYAMSRTTDPSLDFDWSTRDKESAMLGCSQEVLNDLLSITDWKTVLPAPVDYPRIETSGQGESYRWFMANKAVSPASPTTPAIEQELPEISKPVLKKYRQIGGH